MSGVREIGERFSYSFYDDNHPYFIAEDDYNAQWAFEDSNIIQIGDGMETVITLDIL